MDINWEFQQENARLRKENAALKKINEMHAPNRVFTDGQLEFMHSHDMNYQEVYRLARKYGSGTDALAELVEGKI